MSIFKTAIKQTCAYKCDYMHCLGKCEHCQDLSHFIPGNRFLEKPAICVHFDGIKMNKCATCELYQAIKYSLNEEN